ncbi:MAG: hypothetical protein JF614_03205 [Acidobacteria bacterium]|nr:hypothetical protein [Acidobacteriota bacterium]
MRKSHLSAAIVLILLTSATAVAWAARSAATRPSNASYTPPAETGMIYTVINYSRAGSVAQHTYVTVDSEDGSRTLIVPGPYLNSPCSTSTPSGFVFRLRHNMPDSIPVTITTTGTIVRGPYQGDVPMELLHACYKLVK